jgi:hypothetical protein
MARFFDDHDGNVINYAMVGKFGPIAAYGDGRCGMFYSSLDGNRETQIFGSREYLEGIRRTALELGNEVDD